MGEQFTSKKYKRGLQWLIGSGFLAVASVGGWFFYARTLEQSREAVTVSAIAIERGQIEIPINASGTVELAGQQTLKSPTDGTVDRVLVKVGDRVARGEELITLRNAEDRTTLATQPLEIRKAQLSLERTRQKAIEAQENLAAAQRELQRLTEENIERQTEIETQQLTITEKELNLETQRQNLASARENLMAAQRSLAVLIDEGSQVTQTKLAQLKLEIEQKELSLANDLAKVVEAEENLAAAQRELAEREELAERGFLAKQQVREQENAVRREQANLRDARLSANTATLERDRAQLRRQEIESEFAQEIDSLQEEVQDAQEAVQTAEQELRSAAFELQRAQLELNKIQRQPLDEVEEARKAVRTAESELGEARLQVNTERLELEKLELEVQKIQQQFAENVVSAPIDGTILAIAVKSGDGIGRGNDLLTLGDPSQELVNLQLSTLDAAKVKPSQEARITVIGPNPETYPGRVKRLSPLASSGNSSESRESSAQALVPATIQLDTPTGTLIPGSQVSVEIVVEQRKDVLVVPIEAIARDGPKPYVWVRDPEGNAQQQTVTLGLEGVTEVEIASGLQPGDRVLLPPPEPPLEPGMPVIVAEEEESEE